MKEAKAGRVTGGAEIEQSRSRCLKGAKSPLAGLEPLEPGTKQVLDTCLFIGWKDEGDNSALLREKEGSKGGEKKVRDLDAPLF